MPAVAELDDDAGDAKIDDATLLGLLADGLDDRLLNKLDDDCKLDWLLSDGDELDDGLLLDGDDDTIAGGNGLLASDGVDAGLTDDGLTLDGDRDRLDKPSKLLLGCDAGLLTMLLMLDGDEPDDTLEANRDDGRLLVTLVNATLDDSEPNKLLTLNAEPGEVAIDE